MYLDEWNWRDGKYLLDSADDPPDERAQSITWDRGELLDFGVMTETVMAEFNALKMSGMDTVQAWKTASMNVAKPAPWQHRDEQVTQDGEEYTLGWDERGKDTTGD